MSFSVPVTYVRSESATLAHKNTPLLDIDGLLNGEERVRCTARGVRREKDPHLHNHHRRRRRHHVHLLRRRLLHHVHGLLLRRRLHVLHSRIRSAQAMQQLIALNPARLLLLLHRLLLLHLLLHGRLLHHVRPLVG